MTEYFIAIHGRPMRKNAMNTLARGRLIPSKRYLAYRKAVSDQVTLAHIPCHLPGLWEIEVIAYWPESRRVGDTVIPKADADAALVPTRDALQRAQVFRDDGQMTRCVCEARVDPDEPRTEITLRRIG